jgi:hypothetical protein
VGKLTVFKTLEATKHGLIVAIHYNRQKVYIRAVLTHDKYDEGKWKEWIMTADVQTAQDTWPILAPVVFVPHAENEYRRLVAVLDNLIDV